MGSVRRGEDGGAEPERAEARTPDEDGVITLGRRQWNVPLSAERMPPWLQRLAPDDEVNVILAAHSNGEDGVIPLALRQ